MNSPEACRRRLLKYVVPVLVLSIVFNVPKFLDAEITMQADQKLPLLWSNDTHVGVAPEDGNGTYWDGGGE